jgi:two-component system, OmpR family, sensor histidine kinase BaeS
VSERGWGPPRGRPPGEGRAGPRGHRAAEGGWGRHRGRRPAVGFFGCLVLAMVLLVALVATLATWIAGALLGAVAPGAAPSTLTAVAVIVVILLAILVGVRVFGSAIRPLADIAAATERLADGEPGVRVRARGPRPVRGLGASFNAMAERLDRSRDDRRALLADVTHELRTPLTVITGGLEAMVDGVHPFDEDHVVPILAETRVMDRLLDDLRTLSLADAGALALHREPADLRAIADEVVASSTPLASARGVTLRAGGVGRLVTSVDPVRVREILANLVANALRHTPTGGSIDVAVGTDRGEAVLTVTDTGEGIAAAELPRIFDRFQRRADSGGSGLGLTIVRDLAAAHGGSVEAASEGVPGRGSTFTVKLPLRD